MNTLNVIARLEGEDAKKFNEYNGLPDRPKHRERMTCNNCRTKGWKIYDDYPYCNLWHYKCKGCGGGGTVTF